jgi:hypothetical protein
MSSCSHNEYVCYAPPPLCNNFCRNLEGELTCLPPSQIVYDVAQVHIKYLLKIKFNHKY